MRGRGQKWVLPEGSCLVRGWVFSFPFLPPARRVPLLLGFALSILKVPSIHSLSIHTTSLGRAFSEKDE